LFLVYLKYAVVTGRKITNIRRDVLSVEITCIAAVYPIRPFVVKYLNEQR